VIIRQAAAGQLDRNTVEAVRAVYPIMYQRIVAAVTQQVAKLNRPLTPQQSASLSLILKTPVTPTQQPDMIAVFQDAFDPNFAADSDAGADGQGGGASQVGSKPARPIDVSGAYKTTVQGMEGRIR